ncbi:N-formylglutamate amidohydrolase [Bordetella ansorpii]|uniref:N-formylglutamate amidohydrolase n=1 Tax=Bordetella ansorpii TaxID=288768 RepID=A0A157LWV6_9BORD|nr:N-formylglutamate amidohydrolase [Bordetella ansorpii]SAI01275.1 N-formylglutamate amidohydrolase [Bordetella ansorpii]
MQEPSLFQLQPGHAPVLMVMPHSGTELPADARGMMTPAAGSMADASWHLERLYAFAQDQGASILRPRYTRYWLDLSPVLETAGRLGDDIYMPRETLHGEPLYLGPPDAAERDRRIQAYWVPFHRCIQAELARLRETHGEVLLWEAHASASVLPGRYPGRRPVLCVGTDAGATCAEPVMQPLIQALAAQDTYSWVVNGRYKGGRIAQKYGNPAEGVHAVSLDICQSAYMNEFAPYNYRLDLAERLQPLLGRMYASALGGLRIAQA